MAQRVVARVAVEQTTFHFDRLYSYVADDWSDDIACGCRVLFPFGKGNRRRQGIVMASVVLTTLEIFLVLSLAEVLAAVRAVQILTLQDAVAILRLRL